MYENKKERTITIEKLGTEKELREKLNGADPYEWAKDYIEELNQKEKEEKREVLVKYSPVKQIPLEIQRTYNGGYLFLQKIYHQLGIDDICKEICNRHKFQYNLDSILSRLLYARVQHNYIKIVLTLFREIQGYYFTIVQTSFLKWNRLTD